VKHAGLMPQLLQRLLTERRQVKARIKELHKSHAASPADVDAAAAIDDVAAVLDARQLTLKLLANASYGFCGADTSHLCCKPLAEACLRYGNHYARAAALLIEAEGMAHQASATSAAPQWPGAHTIYANTDSVFVKLPGRTAAQAVEEGRQMAKYVSTHTSMPGAALTLEFERVLAPCLLDGHNRYAGAEWVTGGEPTPKLHQKGLLERTQCNFIRETILEAMRALLIEGSMEAALTLGLQAARALRGGKVDAAQLVEGGFLKRANQKDLVRMAGLGHREAVDSATRESDRTLSKQNNVALAIALLKATAVDGQPSRVFRLGEYVPFVLVHRSGGASGSKQFENVASLDEVILHRTPVDIKLIYSNRLLRALFGQVQERTGGTTKAAAAADKPSLLGRLLSPERVAAFRAEASRVSHDGVLTCTDGYRLYGLSAPPKANAELASKTGGQMQLGSFFKKPAAAPMPSASEQPALPTPEARAIEGAAAGLQDRSEKLRAQRAVIARASGRLDESEPLLLHNLAAPLANVQRQL